MFRRHCLTWPAYGVALSLLTAGGCLSLGGKTTYVHESPETPARLSSLEERVSAVEQALVRGPIGLPGTSP